MEELVYFGEERPRSAPYTVKQLIAREIELEKMRRAEVTSARATDRVSSAVSTGY